MRTLTHLVEYGRRRPAARPTARRNSPSAAPPVAFPRQNSPSTAQKRRIWGVLSALGELFRARTHTRPSRATNFAHSTQKHGDIETNNTTAHPQQGTTETAITSAPENCTKNTHFSPAKAITVSIPHRHKQAKATAVSGHRATSPAAPTRGTRRRRNQDGIKTTRRAKLAARTARGRAAAHGHAQQPGPPAQHNETRPRPVSRPRPRHSVSATPQSSGTASDQAVMSTWSSTAARPASRRATGTRNGEQDT